MISYRISMNQLLVISLLINIYILGLMLYAGSVLYSSHWMHPPNSRWIHWCLLSQTITPICQNGFFFRMGSRFKKLSRKPKMYQRKSFRKAYRNSLRYIECKIGEEFHIILNEALNNGFKRYWYLPETIKLVWNTTFTHTLYCKGNVTRRAHLATETNLPRCSVFQLKENGVSFYCRYRMYSKVRSVLLGTFCHH